MTAVDEAPDDSRQEYAWGLAPSHLVTRRQLRKLGKSPGKSLVAVMVGKVWGRRVVASLFDPALAPAKRVPSDAQRASIAKATRERQLRTAERHGISRAEMNTPITPVPGWDQDTSKEGKSVSANPSQSSERPKTLSQRLRELNPEGRYSGKASGWGLADEVFTELIADGLDPAVVTDKVHRGSRNGYQAALLMRSIHDNARRAAAEQGAAAPDPVPAAPPQQPATAAPEPAPVATDGEQAAAAPGSYGQRMAYLMLSVALHKARVQREQIDQASELRARVDAITERSDERMGMEAELQYMDQELAAAREQAQQRLNTTEWPAGREAEVDLLADAVVWFDQDDEQMADPACKWLTDLDGYFTTTWGLEIDVDTWTPKVNRQFDAVTEQQEWEEAAAVARASGVYQVLAGMKNVPAPVLEAVAVWRDDGTTPKPAGRYVAGEPERYAQLQRALAAAGLNPRLRAGVEFLVDYARGDLSKTDLAQTPILVNPAEEVRGRVAGMLEHFATNPQHAKIIGQEIAVMTEEDQAQVRAAGKRIAAGEKVDPQLWPGWINRDELTDRIRDFARDAREVAYYAQALATGEAEGIDDDIQVQIDDMRDDRAAINAMLGAQGLHPIEKAHLQAVMADISVGRIDDRTLPEVLLIDERSKQDVDDTRQMRAAGTLAADVVTEATQLLERDRGQAMNPKSKVGKRLDRIGGNLRDVAQGHNSADQLRQYRTSYDENMGELGKALAQAGVEVPIRMRVRSVLDTGARRAGQHGRDRDQRDTLWANRIRSGAVTASREADAATHRAAVAAGQAMPPERACAKRPTPAAGQTTPAGPAARVARLHHGEVGR